MEFPISRETLQNIRPLVDRTDREKYVKAVVDTLKRKVIVQAYNTPLEKLLKVDVPLAPDQVFLQRELLIGPFSNVRQLQSLHLLSGKQFNPNEALPEVIEQLKLLFPGVSFQVDPLKTYLLIDWS